MLRRRADGSPRETEVHILPQPCIELNVLFRLRRRAALGAVLLVAGCASPLWEYDHYVVDGALLGTTCKASIDGRPFVGNFNDLGEKILFPQDASPPDGRTMTGLVCRGLILEFVSPEGTRPAPGRYRIVSHGIDTGTVQMSIHYSGIDEGNWPFASTGVHLEGKEGYVQLDELTDSSVRATFHVVVRRQPNGE
jgi:hypothetical protein